MRRNFKVGLLVLVLAAVLALASFGSVSQAQASSTFRLDSPASVVLAAMGEPSRKSVTSLDDQTWYYGASRIRFVHGVVREYVNTGNLAVNLGSKSTKPFFIWLGCHRVTVIAALGTPTSVTRTTSTGAIWGYGKSSITMRNDKVAGWTDKGELKNHFRVVTAAKTATSPWLTLLPTQKTQTLTVYITRTGSKYHRYGCRYLRQSCIAIDRSTAISEGYTPCSICNPP